MAQLFPSCTHCAAVQTTGAWLHQDGSCAKTVEKLHACGTCSLARYCNSQCQKKDWKVHKIICKPQTTLSSKELDQSVQELCTTQAGKILLRLTPQKSVEMLSKKEDGKLEVEVMIEEKRLGPYSYVICNPVDSQLQSAIDKAAQLPSGYRDMQMQPLALQLVEKGFYDYAFVIVSKWITIDCVKITFFRSAALTMVSNEVSHEKIVELAKTIHLTDEKILTEVIGIYSCHNHLPLACQLARQSNKSDYYFEIIFSALLNAGKKEEAKAILDEVSSAKRRDLQFYIH